ncbi:hypothetical protein Ahy_B05g076660 isoform E [Arachis hypogaea]|uniref:Small ribosomal subunit protein uS3 C-terminal domain-containing protein n=1 Tax=Arachis hypogaea TaxID=3818 RepID=A0A444Z3Q5_ARAHY|nr:hypothetical protein Ahy_B05g076660 isoform E [Arachis hypogaea]
MKNGAKGCEVIVSGKLRAQRAKSMKFKDGYMISSGQPVKNCIDSAVRHVLLRQAYTSELQLKVDHLLEENARLKRQQQKACIFIYIHKYTHLMAEHMHLLTYSLLIVLWQSIYACCHVICEEVCTYDNCNKGKEKTQLKLDWSTRRKICIGVAKDLAYLHGESRLKIVG